MAEPLPQFILFGASMTEWSFEEQTEGFGWFLEKTYRNKVDVVNEGRKIFLLPILRTQPTLARFFIWLARLPWG